MDKFFNKKEFDADVAGVKDAFSPSLQKKLGLTEDTSRKDAILEMASRAGKITMKADFDRGETPFPVPYRGASADNEIVFTFESDDDAKALYDFIIESELLAPGEITRHSEQGQYTVHFAPHVLITKPEVIDAAFVAYDEKFPRNSMNVESLERVQKIVEDFEDVHDAVLTEAGRPTTRRGRQAAQKGKGAEYGVPGNPYHDKDDGKFTSYAALVKAKFGSRSKAKIKRKVKKSGKGINFVVTKNPCGRDARAKGKDFRCWDGKVGYGFRTGAELGRTMKKFRKESTSRWGQNEFALIERVNMAFEARLSDAEFKRAATAVIETF